MLFQKLFSVALFIALSNAKNVELQEADSTDTIELDDIPTTSAESIDEWDDLDSDNDTNVEEPATRVNGGRPVAQLVPYQVSLQMPRFGRYHHFCSGSIISAHHVLTAAHCLANMNANDISVVAGTLTWRRGGERHRVIAMRSHPSFSSSSLIINDIAVLKVTPPFNLGKSTLGTIALSGTARIGENVPVRLTGWGSLTPTGSSGLPEQLQVLDYRTVSNMECAQQGFRITANELCALGERGRGACVGDSGGPLITLHGSPQLVGIVSYGTATCAQGRPDVYTRVSSFLPYINKVITSEMP
ncbi:chymotrypsin-2-like [Rhagoletis pomonella]|uniref:chymotrypsin-2-like n=1 Tax=Rhagoletis pomonella TaxID=28610 RepID=UPI00177AA4C9|nr:chymotrypsin-2-like [Rhagoletis pomonella]